jgi:hypothetical protein
VKPTYYLNEHGQRFELVGYELEPAVPEPVLCAQLRPVGDDLATWVPVGSFRRHFTCDGVDYLSATVWALYDRRPGPKPVVVVPDPPTLEPCPACDGAGRVLCGACEATGEAR